MKQLTVFIIFICCNTLIALGQNKINDTIKESLISIESITVKYITSELGWRNLNGTWTYNGESTDTVPMHYTIHKEIVTIDSLNGQLKSKHCFIEIEEILIQCETFSVGWLWENNKWYFEGKETNNFPPNYSFIREKNKTISDYDCMREHSPTNTSSIKTIEKEYYVIDDSDWLWNGKKRTWQHKDKSLNKKVPSYEKITTIITTLNMNASNNK